MQADLDFETGSAAELVGPRSVGVHRYFEDETTRVWLFSWQLGHGLVYRYHPGDPDPLPLLEHIARGGKVVAHNAMFERIAWAFIKQKYRLYHWPDLQVSQQKCTMAKAMALNLPASLEVLGKVLDAKEKKAPDGTMKRMAKPRRQRDGTLLWVDDDASISDLGDYCDQDVRAEAWVDNAVPDLSPYEQSLWELDQLINDHGIPLDVPSIMRAVDVVEYAKTQANVEMRKLTNNQVSKCTEVQKIVEWLNQQGLNCVSFTKNDHDDIIELSAFMGNDKVEKVVQLRKDTSKTSTAKFLKMLECVCNDGRARGQFQFNGATQTLRWAGRLVQFQNLKRIDWEKEGYAVQFMLWVLNAPLSTADTYNMIEMTLGRPLHHLSLALRAMIKAEPGYTLYCADFSNIEGRFNAWLAGEVWKLKAFAEYDAGTGPDLYKLAYSRSFGIPVEQVGKGKQRQIGKVQELALGFQGNIGALLKMALTYDFKLWEAVDAVSAATPPETWDQVISEFSSARDKNNLLPEVWTAGKIIVKNWRGANPAIVASWYELQDAALLAVDQPGQVIEVYSGRVRYLSDKNFLYCQLPNGQIICYPQPHIRHEKTEYVEVNGEWLETDRFFEHEITLMKLMGARFKSRNRNVVYFYGIDPETKQWSLSYLYGGHQCENIVQSTARAVLARALGQIASGGYPIILHSHDEILAHVRKGVGSLKHFESLMRVDEPWLAGLPLSVSSFEDERYVK